jgi:succinoglycan biosynthesis transport protein ExoP
MLYTRKSDGHAGFEIPENSIESPAESVEKFISFLRRQLPTLLFTTVACTVLGTIYLVSAPPLFTARTSIIIDARKVQLFQQQSILGDIPVDSAGVESQLGILKSEQIALSVIKKLHLTDDPEFSGSHLGIIGAALKSVSALFSSDVPASDFELSRAAIQVFQSQLSVKRDGLSYIIDIFYKSLNADRAAEIANAVADAYIVDQLEAKDQATRRASNWLESRIDELRKQASQAERAVVEFKASNNIVNTGGTGGRLITEQQVSELNSQVVVARAQMAEAKARLDRIESVLRADSPTATVNSTVADALKSEVVTKLRSQYLELANREADWSRRYGSDHLAAINLRNQMREIQNSILNELQRLAETYKSDYEIAKQRESGVQSELEQAVRLSKATNQAQVSLKELESSSQTYRTLYDNFLQRYMESMQQQSFPISEARVISQASRPLRKSEPKTFLVLAISIFGGAIAGLGLGIIRDLADRVFRNSNQVEAQLNVECIALVPALTDDQQIGNAGQATLQNPNPLPPRTIPRDTGLIWAASEQPFSRFAEALRSIKLAIDLNGADEPCKTIGITSSLPNEGKSVLSISLAELIAQTGARVLLIDGDLRNSALTERLSPGTKAGIADVIAQTRPLREILWRDPITNMDFLPGAVQRLSNSNELLASSATKKLFETLRSQYDYIVLDLSPLAPIVDARATKALVDSYILAVEWGRTRFDVAARALKSAPEIRDNLLGAVLTKVNFKKLDRQEGYGNYYDGGSYYDDAERAK